MEPSQESNQPTSQERSGRETKHQQQSAETREAIMQATLTALCKHGYTDLRMRDIGDEFELSRPLIHYHYEGKEDLITALLDYLIEIYETNVELPEAENPADKLDALIDQLLFGPDFEEEGFDHWTFMMALEELRSQAQHNDTRRQVLQTNRERIVGYVEAAIQDGIEAGSFRDMNATRAAELLVDTIEAAKRRKITLNDDDALAETRKAIDDHILSTF